jgi:hypothetical protein
MATRILSRSGRAFRGGIALLGALLLLAARAAAADVQIESPNFQFDAAANVYRYQDAKVRFGNVTVEAQEVLIHPETGNVRINGQVRVREGSLFIAAGEGEFNAETGAGTLKNAKLHDAQTGYFLTAETLRRRPGGGFTAEGCTLTACPPFVPGWKISASHVDYGTETFATGSNARLELGNVPVFWFPVLAWPTVEKRQSGFLRPEYSQETSTLARYSLGSRLLLPYYWALGPDHDLTVMPETIEQRGNALGLEYRYAFSEGQTAKLRLWGIEETHGRVPSQENVFPELAPGAAAAAGPLFRRFTADWNHNAAIGDAGRLVFSAASSSDGQVRREYERRENYRPELSYQASLSHQSRWGDTALTGEHASEFTQESIYANGARFSDGRDRPELRPEFTYLGGFRPFSALPLGLRLTAQAVQFNTASAVSGQALVARPALSMPIELGEGVELRLTAARNHVAYSGLSGPGDSVVQPEPEQGFSQGDGQIELRADFGRVYGRNSGPWTAIKHVFSPRLILDAAEDVAQPLADAVVRAVPARSLGTLRLDNTWLGRSGESPASELGQLNLIQRYNFLREDANNQFLGPALPAQQETDPGQPVLPLIFQGGFTSGKVQIGIEAHYHHQLRRFTESSISARGSVRGNSTLGISYTQNEFSYWTPENKLHPETNAFGFTGELAATDSLSIGFEGRLNLRNDPAPLDRRMERDMVFIDFHPICYRIRATYEESLELTKVGANDQYFVNRRFSIAFDLGGVLGASRQTAILPGGAR